MKLVSKDIMDYIIQASKDRDCIFEKWRHTIDLNTDILGDNKKLIELVSETNDRNEELLECIRSNNKDIIRLCDVLNGILKRMDDIDLRLNVLYWCTRSENALHSFRNGLQNNIAGVPIYTDEEK